MLQERVSFKRSRGVRVAPIAGLLASAAVMTRGSDDWLFTLIAGGIFVVAAFAAWWTWNVPLATFDAPILFWKEVPQRSAIEVDAEQIRAWRYDKEVNCVKIELRDGQLKTFNLNAMSQEDVPRFLGLMDTLDGGDDQATGDSSLQR